MQKIQSYPILRVIIIGPPGTYRKEVCKNTADYFNLVHISTRELIDNEIKNNTEVGKQLKP